jgi:hypothetical protein
VIPIDKVLHLLVGIALGANPVIEPMDALVVTTIVAIGKEVYDSKHKHKHTPDWRDAAITVAGGFISFGIRMEF